MCVNSDKCEKFAFGIMNKGIKNIFSDRFPLMRLWQILDEKLVFKGKFEPN